MMASATSSTQSSEQQRAGKKKKTKGQTLSLQSFLNESENSAPEGFTLVSTGTSWADELDDNDDKYPESRYTVDYATDSSFANSKKIILPTAPKSVRAPDVDLNEVPTSPPFKAYLGNLPYDLMEDDVHQFFKRLHVADVQLPRENSDRGGRLRGFGYAEFPDRETLIEALSFNNEYLKNRPIRVSLSSTDHDHDGNRRMGDRRMGDYDRNDQEDRTVGDWRTAPREDRSMDSRTGSRDYGRNNFSRNDHDGFDSRGSDRGRSDYDRRDFKRGQDSGGFVVRDRGYNDRGFDMRRAPPQRDDADGFRRGPRTNARQDFGSNFGDRDRDRPRRDYEPRRSPPPMHDEPHRERPKLVLKPRSIPMKDEKQETAKSSGSAIFGGAKPVDTAAKEREIEEKLRKQSLTDHQDEPQDEPQRGRRRSNASNASH